MSKKLYKCITGLALSDGYVPPFTRTLIFFESAAKTDRTLHNAAMRAARKHWEAEGMGYHTPTVSHIRPAWPDERL